MDDEVRLLVFTICGSGLLGDNELVMVEVATEKLGPDAAKLVFWRFGVDLVVKELELVHFDILYNEQI